MLKSSSAAAILLAAPSLVAGHGALMQPFSWHDVTGKESFEAGCTGKSAPGEIEHAQGCVGEWYTNNTNIPGTATIPVDSSLTTYGSACAQGLAICCGHVPGRGPYSGCDWTKKHPWRSPGTAPIASPCGIDGGNPDGCPAGNPTGKGCAGGGYGHGPDGRTLMGQGKTTEWVLGGEAVVSWAIVANHGGGYSYRLCPKPVDGMELTEECFQKTVLRFAGDTQNITSRTTGKLLAEIPARRTDVGTFPTGSEWTRNPIPACKGFGGGAPATGGVCKGTQFEPPADGVFGFLLLPYNIIDRVQVPSDLAPGEYVLSFRYDCEQTAQVWNQCAHVQLKAPTSSSSSKSTLASKLHKLSKLQQLKQQAHGSSSIEARVHAEVGAAMEAMQHPTYDHEDIELKHTPSAYTQMADI